MPQSSNSVLPVGIIVPMQEEVELLIQSIENLEEIKLASRIFYKGSLCNKSVVLAKSGIGKVASSFTASLLIHKLRVQSILITGVAGGIADDIAIGDLAIATKALQHDMDCRPLFPQFEIPTTGITHFIPDSYLTSTLEKAAFQFINEEFEKVIDARVLKDLGLERPKLQRGLLISGDQFIGTHNQWEKIRAEIIDALFVEMEGAAVAQVCQASDIPWCTIRTISDKANAIAHVDFSRFLNHAAKIYTAAIVKQFLKLL